MAASAGVLVLGLSWLTWTSLRKEAVEHDEAERTEQAARLRSAAARMDAWIGPVLAREAGRHHSDYSSYGAARRAYTAALTRIPAGEVIEPSPLLGFRAETIRVHFQWSPVSGASSPQVPRGRFRDLALASGLDAEELRVAEERLQDLATRVEWSRLAETVRARAPAPRAPASLDGSECVSPDELAEGPLGAGLTEAAGSATVGPLVPAWLPGEELLFVRDVASRDGRLLQGFVVDWAALSTHLLATAGGDAERARLVAGREGGGGVRLATIPATLSVPSTATTSIGWTPLRLRLTLAWLALGLCLTAATVTLAASLRHAEERARFASAMSHELRTPLTTLCMYSEMLADGVITDETQRQAYVDTIRSESERLAALAENVLAHARLERREPSPCKVLALHELLDGVTPALVRRARAGGMELVLEGDLASQASVEVDPDAVGRVLLNLVDNACKYAGDAEDRRVRLGVRCCGNHVELTVQDAGPGIPGSLARDVFRPFRRGDDVNTPGAGIGLAISRDLARDLGGELSLLPAETGARFQLRLRSAT